jgi:hypothetical protein
MSTTRPLMSAGPVERHDSPFNAFSEAVSSRSEYPVPAKILRHITTRNQRARSILMVCFYLNESGKKGIREKRDRYLFAWGSDVKKVP